MRKYHIAGVDINRSVRGIGSLIRAVSPPFTEELFCKENRIMDRFVKGLWLSRRTWVQTVFVTRKDKSRLRLLICRAKKREEGGEKKVTGLLWIHGGGYAIGLPEQDFLFADLFCGDASCVAVLPDYTRSAEAPYPAALEDCYLALQWIWRNADKLGINRRQIFVGGDSAGGGLTAALCLYARDRGEIPVAFQMPLYPMLDDRELTASSRNNDAPVWNTKANREGWGLYLRALKGSGPVPCYAAPARAEDYRGLPPACTYVGTIDPFYDETMLYCDALKREGIPVHRKVFEGCFHAFDLVGYPTRPAREARKFLREVFRYAQRNYFREP